MGFKEHGAAQLRLDGEDGGIEALQMAGLQNALALFRALDQIVGLGERGGQRLFDQQVEAGIEQSRSYLMMVHGGNGDAGGVQMQIGRQQFVHGREDGDCVFGCRIGCAGAVRFDGCHQCNAEAGLLQFAVNTKVIAAKGPGSGYGYAQNRSAGYFAAPFPSTAVRQRP